MFILLWVQMVFRHRAGIFFCSFHPYRSMILWLIALLKFSLLFWSIIMRIFIPIFGKCWRNIKIYFLTVDFFLIWVFFHIFIFLVISHWSTLFLSHCVFPSGCHYILFTPYRYFSKFVIRVFSFFFFFRRIFYLSFISLFTHWLYWLFCILLYWLSTVFGLLLFFFLIMPVMFSNLLLTFLTFLLFCRFLILFLLSLKECNEFR